MVQTERRQLSDRRKSPTKPLSKYIFKGKRKKARRLNDDRNYYVDRYDARYLALVLSILMLCVFDAYFTLKIIHFGGKELNPLMIKFIERNPEWCLALKYLVTVISLVILLLHKNFIVFDKIKAGAVIYLIFFLYFFLVLYEAAIFFGHAP
jgi:hypothetical protein